MTQTVTMPFPVRLKTTLKFDPVLLTLSMLLLLGGFVVLASASTAVSASLPGDNPFFYLQRQIVAVAIGLIGAAVCLAIPMEVWRKTGPLLLLCGFVLLFLVLVPGVGDTVNGATRWIGVGPIRIQPSEPARLCFILYTAGYLVRRSKDLQETFSGFLRPMFVVMIAVAALLAEPDFGASLVLMTTVLAMLFIAGARVRDFLVFVALGVVAFSTLALTSSYRRDRLTGFLDPWQDPFNTGYQLTHSLIAIGRGEWLGVGLGNSVQKLFYLPEAHTDFVFAVYAEEFGLAGSIVAVALFFALVWRIFAIARRASEAGRDFEAFVAVGIGTWFGLQAFINFGVNMGLLPTKGLTLPLVSYGRSAMIVSLASLAILHRIHHELTVDSSPVNCRVKAPAKRAGKGRTGRRAV